MQGIKRNKLPGKSLSISHARLPVRRACIFFTQRRTQRVFRKERKASLNFKRSLRASRFTLRSLRGKIYLRKDFRQVAAKKIYLTRFRIFVQSGHVRDPLHPEVITVFWFGTCPIPLISLSSLIFFSMAETTASFKPTLGLLDATMIVAGSMIGSGIFIVSADITRMWEGPGG